MSKKVLCRPAFVRDRPWLKSWHGIRKPPDSRPQMGPQERFQSFPWARGRQLGASAGRGAHAQSTAIKIHTKPPWGQEDYHGLGRSLENSQELPEEELCLVTFLTPRREPHTQVRVSPSVGARPQQTTVTFHWPFL